MSAADPDALRARAQALIELRRHGEAEALLVRVVAAQPDDHRALCLLALARNGLHKPAEMLEAANAAVALAPDEEWGHRLASIALVDLHSYATAVQAAAEAVRLEPSSSLTHLQYAMAASHVPRLTQNAYAAARRATELAPHHADAHFALGWASAAAGRHEEVADHYREALRLDPQHASARNNLTNLSGGLRLGRRAAGYAAALRADPGAEYAQRNLESMLGRFLMGVLGLSVLVMVVCAVAPAESRLSWLRAATGLGLVVVAVGGGVLNARAVPPGARAFLRSRVRRDRGMLTLLVLTVLAVLVAEVAAYVPVGTDVARSALRPVWFMAVALGVGVIRRSHGRR